MWGVTRHIQPAVDGNPVNDEMHFFNNNLVRPGAYAGIHPQLVEYDASRDDGVWVGRNQPQIAPPGGTMTARYYAGHLEYVPVAGRNNRRSFEIQATPVEFGGSNLLSADRIKQPQKGLFGSLVIEPAGSTYAVDTQVPDGQGGGGTRPTRAQMTIDKVPNGPDGIAGTADDGKSYREAIAVALEAYCVDCNCYPPYGNPLDFDLGGEAHHFLPVRLTTPIAYITGLYDDVFPVLDRHPGVTIERFHPFHYLNDQQEETPVAAVKYRLALGRGGTVIWMVRSHGPDVDCDEGEAVYDPTNGTISNGDIMRFGP